MLNKVSTVIGVNLSDIFVNSGIKLVPKKNTLLAELVNNSNVGGMVTSKGMDNESISSAIEYSSLGSSEEINGQKRYLESSHDSIMDNYAIDLSKLVNNYISFSRNVVNKEINIVKESLEESLKSYMFKDPEDFFKVEWFKMHNVYSGSIVSEVLSSDWTGKYFRDNVNLDALNVEGFDLCKYLLVGDEDEDKDITDWINKITIEKLRSYIVEDISEYNLNVKDLLEYSLCNYLFYRNIVERKDISIAGTSLAVTTKASNCRDYYAQKLKVAVDLYNRDIRVGKLVCSTDNIGFSFYNEKEKYITVYQDSFDKLAEQGGSLELLFGYMCSNESSYDVTVDNILQKSDKWLGVWKNSRSLYIIVMENSKLDIFKRVLSEVFYLQCNKEDISSEEKEFFVSNSGFKDETIQLGNEYIKNLSKEDIEDLDRVCITLIAKIRFRFSNAYEILSSMNSILSENEDMEVMEAALYSVIQYLTDYMLQQMDVVKV